MINDAHVRYARRISRHIRKKKGVRSKNIGAGATTEQPSKDPSQ